MSPRDTRISQTSALSANLSQRLHTAPKDPRLALIFPGQGSHQVGAGRDVHEAFPLVREIFQRADEILGQRLSLLCFQGPEEELRDTANAQPAILAVSLACLTAALESGTLPRAPAFVAGHSLGEFTALVAAGSLQIEDALLLVATRGRLMREASRRRPGTMAAIIGLNGEALDEVCRESGVEPCNYNSPAQVVVGGTLEAVELASRLTKERGGRALPMSVSGAFHTSLMASAAAEFAAAVDACSILEPTLPVIANGSAEPLSTAEAVRQELSQQMTQPVLWHQSIMRMASAGATTFAEVGPGRVLSGLIKRAGPGLTAVSVDSVESLEALRHV